MKLGYTIIDVTDVAASTLNECQLFQILNVVFGHKAEVAKQLSLGAGHHQGA